MYVDQWNEKRYAKRDAALIYYMQTHPEDFPVTGMYPNEFPFIKVYKNIIHLNLFGRESQV